MRLRPDKEADRYHDDYAYRNLRKDVEASQNRTPSFLSKIQKRYYPGNFIITGIITGIIFTLPVCTVFASSSVKSNFDSELM